LTFITAGYPFVDNVSTFYFGNTWDDWWWYLQTDEPEHDGEDGSQIAFSWQNVAIPASETVERSFIVRFGPFESSRVTLGLEFPPLTEPVHYLSTLAIQGNVQAEPDPTANHVTLWVVVDDDESELKLLGDSYVLNTPFTLNFIPNEYGLGNGAHILAFYAIDSDGDISPAQSATITVSDPPVPTGSRPFTVSFISAFRSRRVFLVRIGLFLVALRDLA
jgi:hypothetical protein